MVVTILRDGDRRSSVPSSQWKSDEVHHRGLPDRDVETELFASQYRWFGLQTVRYPMLEVTGKVVPLTNEKGFAFELIRIDPA